MIAVTSLSCQELVELVTDYFEGALSEEDLTRFERHLVPCANCKAYIEQMRTTIALTGRVESTGLGQEALAELLRAFRDWKAGG
jgi:anti-sigma factor RsiW